MLKKLLMAVGAFVTTGFVFAQVDVNKADQAALDSVKGVGPKTSQAILGERKQGGEFKDWSDFERRVKGVGEKSAVRLSEAGLVVNGQARPAASAKDVKQVKHSESNAKPNKAGSKETASTGKNEQKK